MRLCELREKEVINSCDCKRLGCVVDIEFDCSSGQIEALIVPGPGKICGFLGTDSEYVIPFHCVKRIIMQLCLRLCIMNLYCICLRTKAGAFSFGQQQYGVPL